MKINCAYFTHPGKVRSVNQDGLFLNGKAISEGNFDSPIIETHHIQNVGLYSVVDGAGGHNAGETASRTILTELKRSVDIFGGSGSVTESKLRNEMVRIQGEMSNMADGNYRLSGMAATLAGVLFVKGKTGAEPPCGMPFEMASGFLNRWTALVFNCGDCRVYSIDDGVLTKISHDHSVVQELCDEGTINEDEMRTNPRRNVVTAALKAGRVSVELNCRRFEIMTGDKFLICCDGVWQALSHENIELRLASKTFADSVHELYCELINTDCDDNISFVIIEIEYDDVC